MKTKIWLSSPHMGSNELEYVKQAFDTNWIAPLGPLVNLFEEKLGERTAVSHVAALSSGTAAIHLSLKLLNVEDGDIVLCQSLTFSASANPIVYERAQPVFIDSEPDTWNMCPSALKEAIEYFIALGRKPKAIIVVHLYGMPAKMEAIMKIASDCDIPVIEDAAEALGSSIDNKPCGSFGTFGVLSFNGNKIITTSGGGALLSENAEHIAKAKFFATQARDTAPHYQHSEIGYNYRLSNVLAGIGIGQLEVLDDRIKARRSNFEYYKAQLSHIPGISFLEEQQGAFSNRWLTCILINPEKNNGIDADRIRIALEAKNIESRPLWKPMHLQPVFADAPYFGNKNAENLFAQGLCLPSGSNLTEEDLQRVVTVIRNIF
ncbi:DegT/DnrJ/EryC1/StrS family aminotransferase [Sediminibacterium ginsengisoli]|uniref:GDP-perosamine synthase n=1 Tax=Sediminibacterium ginsengisoli TaxID=413434 RepID=A0A1T4N4D3_9BACT|nr:DegT/DnrJ/EryC1/StrS family aminotransferase [Sediminibacterium ginsengisoli]SJZ74004.1 DegT/DnrJ/EryC1/StrS aminotransferase family protein [Sediminibacterium ginsengisoli]